MSGLRSIISIWNYGPFPPIRCFGFCGDPFRAAGSASKAQSWLAQSDGVFAKPSNPPGSWPIRGCNAWICQRWAPLASWHVIRPSEAQIFVTHVEWENGPLLNDSSQIGGWAFGAHFPSQKLPKSSIGSAQSTISSLSAFFLVGSCADPFPASFQLFGEPFQKSFFTCPGAKRNDSESRRRTTLYLREYLRTRETCFSRSK